MGIARIYKPTKNAMQSGTRNSKDWLLEFEHDGSRFTDPMMGWPGTSDMTQEIRLRFTTKEDAIRYAEQYCEHYIVDDHEDKKTIKPKSYANNFTTKKPPTSMPFWS